MTRHARIDKSHTLDPKAPVFEESDLQVMHRYCLKYRDLVRAAVTAARMVRVFDRNGRFQFGNAPETKINTEANEMKSKIKLNETLYQSGCPGCYPGITSATPVAWICEDTYAVILRQDGAYRVEDMSAQELSLFENCTPAQKEEEKNKALCELIDEIVGVHPERLARLLLAMPEKLQEIRPLLDSARKSLFEIELDIYHSSFFAESG